ncbi:hypothetical protein [Streptomyces sp. NPDC058665]|uniref:hypothetical protein n=1 Tax=Streptomyces sp. NPDC058665 TaxID=3346586 RepID=UPI0036590782
MEIQLVYVEYMEVEPRLLELVQRRISTNAHVDRSLFMIASLDEDVDRLLRRRRGEFAAIDLHLGDSGDDASDVGHRMSEVLTAVDHYDMTTPVHDPGGFFGRTAELQQTISTTERGGGTSKRGGVRPRWTEVPHATVRPGNAPAYAVLPPRRAHRRARLASRPPGNEIPAVQDLIDAVDGGRS